MEVEGMISRFYNNAKDLIQKGYYTYGKRIKPDTNKISKENKGIIGELKFRSPSSGALTHEDLEFFKDLYCNSILDSISVLTEPNFFGGNINYLDSFADCGKPVLMKDFIIDKRQIYSGFSHGADIILLIIKLTRKFEIDEKELIEYSHSLGLQVITEVNNREELEYSKHLEGDFIGINSRDLDNLKVDKTKFDMVSDLKGYRAIAMSSIETPGEIIALWKRGFHFVLIGSAFMKDPGLLIKMKNTVDDMKW